jgi:hypothetical protein
MVKMQGRMNGFLNQKPTYNFIVQGYLIQIMFNGFIDPNF